VTILTDRIPLASVLSGDRSVLARIIDRIKSGQVFVYPTETIYGIGGRADFAPVEERIVSIKSRKKESAFILVAADVSSFSSFDLLFPPKAKLLAGKFWPGNLTLILPSKQNARGFGVRISNHPFISAVCGELNVPLFSTSANMSGEPYSGDPDGIFKKFDDRVDFFIDAGFLPESKPSTIVKVTADDSCEVLREGAIGQSQVIAAFA
jgi:L-threonylcarbamoyladenylate synthase